MWELSRSVRLFGGRHGVAPAVVAQVQRERLLEGMVKVVARIGYHETSVEKVLVEAGVSRRTFYDLFADREDCFLAAYDEVVTHAITLIVQAYRQDGGVAKRIQRSMEAFFGFCKEEPEAARVCIVEVLAAGPRARARRADTMERLADLVGQAFQGLPRQRKIGPLAARALVGGVHELVYDHVDRGEVDMLPALAEQIVASQVTPLVAA